MFKKNYQYLTITLVLFLGSISIFADDLANRKGTGSISTPQDTHTARFAGAISHRIECEKLSQIGNSEPVNAIEAKLKCLLKADAISNESELIEILFD